jgi:hypothetical protein
MTGQWLHNRIRRHNALYLTLGIVFVPTAIGLWFASFWAFRLLIFLATCYWVAGAWKVSYYAAWAAIVLLAIECLRRNRRLFDLEDYAKSGYYDNILTETASGIPWTWDYGNPLGHSYLVSQFLLLAPQGTVQIFRMFRNRVRATPEAITAGARILQRLTEERKWHAVTDFPGQGVAIFLLHRLGLLRTQCEDGQTQIRLRLGEIGE